jgi:hypothetical protein
LPFLNGWLGGGMIIAATAKHYQLELFIKEIGNYAGFDTLKIVN